MQITQVHYQHLVNLGDYENERVGAWGNVDPNETPQEALELLKAWVEEQVGAVRRARTSLEDLNERIYQSNADLRRIQGDLELAQKRWDKARSFLTALNLPLPQRYEDDIPF
jgi:predicted trehalose synthase